MSDPNPKEIRECYADYRDEWSDTRTQGELDMRAISIDGPWDAQDRKEREDNGRPCIHLDRINQQLNQYVGNLHRTRRAIQLTPKGDGANDEDAARRSSIVRGIEEQSNAPTGVYIPAAVSAAQRSYGFAAIRAEYADDTSFDQHLIVKPVPNPDCVLLNPSYQQPNASDVADAFLLEPVSKKEFQRKYGKNAQIRDFEGEDYSQPGVSDWIKEKHVLVAEYWRIEHDLKTLLMIRRGLNMPAEIVWKDELENRDQSGRFKKILAGIEVMREREVKTPRVVQYMTNGLEILDKVPWGGSRIPIIACFGPERWETAGGKARRTLLSLVRFARDPQMLLDFLASQECEEAGMIPKTPVVGAVGQFETDKQTWDEIHAVPHGYVQYDIVVDESSGNLVPPPQRPTYQANFDQWELAKDSADRSIQAGMGTTPLPNAAQRANQKSGVALEKIQSEEDVGTQAFIDNFEHGFLHNIGWQLNELITVYMDNAREVPVSAPDGKRGTLQTIGRTSHPRDQQGAYDVQGLPEEHLHTGKGIFDVTINSGPSVQSEREEQGEFADSLLENAANLPQPGTPAAKVLALAIRMRPTLGPVGKQIADIFDPPDPSNLPPQAQAAIQQLQAQMNQLAQENAALHMERAGKILELKNKQILEVQKGQNMLDKGTLDLIAKIVVAELAKGSKASEIQANADAQRDLKILGFNHDSALQGHDQAHEAGLAAIDQQHQKDLAKQNSDAAAAQQAAAAAAEPQAAPIS